jgi:hypothetical protein
MVRSRHKREILLLAQMEERLAVIFINTRVNKNDLYIEI